MRMGVTDTHNTDCLLKNTVLLGFFAQDSVHIGNQISQTGWSDGVWTVTP